MHSLMKSRFIAALAESVNNDFPGNATVTQPNWLWPGCTVSSQIKDNNNLTLTFDFPRFKIIGRNLLKRSWREEVYLK